VATVQLRRRVENVVGYSPLSALDDRRRLRRRRVTSSG
jgi:hypothetical protein